MCVQLVRVAIQLCHSRRRWLETHVHVPVHTRCTHCSVCNVRATHVHVRFRQAAGGAASASLGFAFPESASLSRRFVTARALWTP
jgi:hypothetical protein